MHRKDAAARRRRLAGERGAESPGEFAGEVKPHAGGGFASGGAGGVVADFSRENIITVTIGHAGSLVGHGDDDLGSGLLEIEEDGGSGIGEFDGVGKEVVNDVFEGGAVDGDHHWRDRHAAVDGDAFGIAM